MNNKWRQGSRIFWTPRFLFSFGFSLFSFSPFFLPAYFPLSLFSLFLSIIPSSLYPFFSFSITPFVVFFSFHLSFLLSILPSFHFSLLLSSTFPLLFSCFLILFSHLSSFILIRICLKDVSDPVSCFPSPFLAPPPSPFSLSFRRRCTVFHTRVSGAVSAVQTHVLFPLHFIPYKCRTFVPARGRVSFIFLSDIIFVSVIQS